MSSKRRRMTFLPPLNVSHFGTQESTLDSDEEIIQEGRRQLDEYRKSGKLEAPFDYNPSYVDNVWQDYLYQEFDYTATSNAVKQEQG